MRQQGYYWVKYEGEWEIAQYRAHKLENNIHYFWSLPAIIYEGWWHTDENFDEIDERRIERNPNGYDLKEAIETFVDKVPPKYISDNPYLCKPDES